MMSKPRGDPRELVGQEVLMQRWPRRCQLSLHPPAATDPPTHPWNSGTPGSELAPPLLAAQTPSQDPLVPGASVWGGETSACSPPATQRVPPGPPR